MYLLPCSHCQASIQVGPKQAGDTLSCPQCGHEVAIPKLGDLKKLPQEDAAADDLPRSSRSTFGQRVGFAVLVLITTLCLLIAAFCGLQWLTTEVPTTTEEHIAELREDYAELPAANLVREYEAIEQVGVDIATPLDYRVAELTRQRWGRNALIAGAFGLLAAACAIGLGLFGARARAHSAPDT